MEALNIPLNLPDDSQTEWKWLESTITLNALSLFLLCSECKTYTFGLSVSLLQACAEQNRYMFSAQYILKMLPWISSQLSCLHPNY